MKRIYSIVLTGGPCSGKTTALSILEQELSNRGYYVLIVPETASELISTGIRPFGNSLEILPFQRTLLEKQLHKEALYLKVANLLTAEKIVIIHDRGIIDIKSYITNDQFKYLLADFNLNEVLARDRYDAVFHLVTAANGAEDFYTLSNNASRTETPEKARELDQIGISNWTGHPHFRIIDNRTNFNLKMQKLLCEVYSFLGDPIPIQIQRKYLIEKPDLNFLAQHVSITVVDIKQTYLKSIGNVERRVRKRGQNGNFSYYFTEKREMNSIKRSTLERKISESDYLCYLSEMDNSLSSIIKQRVCFAYNSQYFVIDIFNFSNDISLMEISQTNENNSIDLPEFIKVYREVTDDPNYRNYNLAKTQKLAI